jgi:hypothetical protein
MAQYRVRVITVTPSPDGPEEEVDVPLNPLIRQLDDDNIPPLIGPSFANLHMLATVALTMGRALGAGSRL